jgi:fibrillarin-like pre-rRNA processing protein
MKIQNSKEKTFENIFCEGKSIYTKALVKEKVYGEMAVEQDRDYFREWNPFRSKYAAGIKNGLKENVFFEKAKVLYLGSAEGTTVSHVSDLIGLEGVIFCVDISEIAMQKLVDLSEKRENLIPILSDANKPENYEEYVDEVDVLFQDISQRNQTEVFLKNSRFLKKNCYGCLSLKTKSISQDSKKETLEKEKEKLKEKFEIKQIVSLEPYEKEHYLILVKKK